MSREAYVTVTVGFAPATTTGLMTGGTTAADEGAPEGLFAALLAMLAPGQTPDAAATDKLSSTEFGTLIQTLIAEATSPAKPAEAVEGEPQEADAAADSSEAASIGSQLDNAEKTQGKALLKQLGDALIALNDSLEAGQPVDPALEKKLGEALDAVAVYLGVVTPPAAIDPRLSALANGEHVLPVAAPTTPPPAAPAPQPPPTGEQPVPLAAPETGIGAPQAADATADAAPEAAKPEPNSQAAPAATAPEALRQLGLAIGKLADKLATADPELARQLTALADGLKSGASADSLATALGLEDAAGQPELERILAALASPRSTRAPEAKPFAAPALTLPDAVTAPTAKAEPTVAEPAPTPRLEAAAPEIAKPASPSLSARAEKPEPADAKPAPAQPNAPPAGATDAATAAANAPSTSPAPLVAAARTIHAAYQAPLQQVNVPQVAFELVRQFEAGNSRFQIRLDPPELGRIDVKLDVDKSGTVNARLTVERPETLDLMQRDQRALQQALQQAGLDGQKTNLEFSLRQNPFAQQGGAGDGRGDQSAFNGRGDGFAGGEDPVAEAATTTYRGSASASGLNLFV